MRRLIVTAALLLIACGGGGSAALGSSAYTVKMAVRLGHAGPVPAAPGFNASYVTEAQPLNPADDVAMQASFPGAVALGIGPVKMTDFSLLPAYLEAARAHPNVRWVYVYDEMGWEGGQVQLGAHEAEITSAARQVQAAGLKSVVSILPDVILSPGFKLLDPSALDVIAIDVYPAGRGTPTVPAGCAKSANPYTDLLACSVLRLRALGYTGAIWYAFEAFGSAQEPDLVTKLGLQRQTIREAPAMGISGLVAFGYWDDSQTNLLAPLYPGHDSAIDALVDCSSRC